MISIIKEIKFLLFLFLFLFCFVFIVFFAMAQNWESGETVYNNKDCYRHILVESVNMGMVRAHMGEKLGLTLTLCGWYKHFKHILSP